MLVQNPFLVLTLAMHLVTVTDTGYRTVRRHTHNYNQLQSRNHVSTPLKMTCAFRQDPLRLAVLIRIPSPPEYGKSMVAHKGQTCTSKTLSQNSTKPGKQTQQYHWSITLR